jgi:hypothetical protein
LIDYFFDGKGHLKGKSVKIPASTGKTGNPERVRGWPAVTDRS